jgi:hypothetical protein
MEDFTGKYSGGRIEEILSGSSDLIDRSVIEYPRFVPDIDCINNFLDIALSYARNIDKLYYGSGETAVTAPRYGSHKKPRREI